MPPSIPPPAEPCFSMRLVRRVVDVLEGDRRFPPMVLDVLKTTDPDVRIPIRVVLQALDVAVQLTDRPELGVVAAFSVEQGDFDVLEYAAASCATAREALAVLARYAPLMSDALEISLEEQDGHAYLEARSSVELSRPACDFQTLAIAAGIHLWMSPEDVETAQVWRTHEAPEPGSEYERLAAQHNVRWGAPYDAIVFDPALLAGPAPGANPNLNAVLRRHAEQLLSELPKVQTFTEQVRQRIVAVLATGAATADGVADAFGMSRRTLTRRLEQEQTNFKALLEQTRQGLARKYIDTTQLPIEEIAFLLGFSGAPAFSKAFKRWTGKSPAEYRRAG